MHSPLASAPSAVTRSIKPMNCCASLDQRSNSTATGSLLARAALPVANKYHSSGRATLQGADVQEATLRAHALHVDSSTRRRGHSVCAQAGALIPPGSRCQPPPQYHTTHHGEADMMSGIHKISAGATSEAISVDEFGRHAPVAAPATGMQRPGVCLDGAARVAGDDTTLHGLPLLGESPTNLTDADMLVAVRDPRAPARWTAWRAQYRPYSKRLGVGKAPRTQAALSAAHRLTTVCTTNQCSALVDLQAAHRATGRAVWVSGAGCAGPRCSANFNKSRFISRQQEMATALLAGERMLIQWPEPPTASHVWLRTAAATRDAADTALRRQCSRAGGR